MPPLKLSIIPVTPFEQNCTILVCDKTNRAALIDPGGDREKIEAAIAQSGATIEKILITHAHFDHVGAAEPMRKSLGVPIEGPHRDDKPIFDALVDTAARYGFGPVEPVTVTRWLAEGDVVTVGDLTFDILHCPGHSPGSVVYVWRRKPEDSDGPDFAVVGDVIFQGSVGRTDLPLGNHQTLIDSIQTKLMTLPDDTVFVCGHGPMSSIGHERQTNPFLT
jgi:glyoxylase-like metal-dependent hydrolase (beta-lactamase superfamily II)